MKFRDLNERLGCLGVLACAVVTGLVTSVIALLGIQLGAIWYTLLVLGLLYGTGWLIIAIKDARETRVFKSVRKDPYFTAMEKKRVELEALAKENAAACGDTQPAGEKETRSDSQ